jgi:hypothetical protein
MKPCHESSRMDSVLPWAWPLPREHCQFIPLFLFGQTDIWALSTQSSFIAVSLCTSSEGSVHVSLPFTSEA